MLTWDQLERKIKRLEQLSKAAYNLASGGGSSYLVASVELTDEQIKALPTTAIEIITTPGVGKALLLLSASIKIDPSAGAYTNINAAEQHFIAYGDGAGGWVDYASKFGKFVSDTNKRIDLVTPKDQIISGEVLPYIYGYLQSVIENKPFVIAVNNSGSGNFTGGNAANTLKVTVYYSVVDL